MDYPLHRDADGRWIHTWVRQSSIKTADMCMERFRKDIYSLSAERPKDVNTFGTACHAVAEDALQARMNGKDETLEGLLYAFDYYWDEAKLLIDDDQWTKYRPETIGAEGYSRITDWYNQIYNADEKIIPTGIEQDFNKILWEDNERVIYARGTIDLVEENRVWDWKFPSRDYSRNKWEYERWDVQSIMYCWATDIPLFRFGIIHPKGVSYIELERDSSHTEWMKQKVLALAKFVENAPRGQWPLGDNGWWCSEKWCPNWARCKGATTGGIN
jgi:hypothetical protein